MIDEAAASVKMGLTTLPSELVKLERSISQLSVEKQALTMEDKTKNKTRISAIDKQLASLNEEYTAAKNTWEQDRQLVVQVKELKEKIQQLQHEASIAEKQTDYNKVAEITHGLLPQTQKALEQTEQAIALAKSQGNIVLKDHVEADDIAVVISKRT